MKFRLFVDYKTPMTYKNIDINAISEIQALKVADMYIKEDLWEERKNIYCVNVYRIKRNNEEFIARYRYNLLDNGQMAITIDWNE